MWNLLRRRLCLIGILLPWNGVCPAGAAWLGQGQPPPAAASPVHSEAVRINPDWYLRGGMLTGRFLGTRAQADWPLWMQALILGRQGVSQEELRHADLYKVPDAFLVRGIQTLEANRVFEPRILQQATAIGYTAKAAEWQEAKSSYQVAYLKAMGLPLQDPLTTSRLLTQLTYRREFDLLREVAKSAKLPLGSLESFLRLMDLREGFRLPSEQWILDRTRPAAERLAVLLALKPPSMPENLVESFKGTDQLDLAVFHAVSQDWISLASPQVSAAIQLRKQPDEGTLWFLVRPEERVSDLLWMRAMEALHQGATQTAMVHAKAILAGYPDSFYAGHAWYLLSGLAPASPEPSQVALRVPGDITLFNASRVRARLQPLGEAWPPRLQGLAARNRFDLILAQADPEQEEETFLRAAFRAGQQDLVTRYLAVARRCSVETAPFLFPLALEPLVKRLIQEEGLTGSVDPAFVLAMIKNESLFQPEAQSGSDAFGIMQLLRPTFAHMVGRDADILDPETNIRAGLRYYRTVIRAAQLESLPEGVRLLYVLAGYHAGEGRARRWRLTSEAELGGRVNPVAVMLRIDAIPIMSTRQYILRVLGDRELFRSFLEGASR